MSAPKPATTLLLTAITLVAFAGNSLLNRLALRDEAIDAATFTAIRLASGAIALLPFVRFGSEVVRWRPGAALALFAYAFAFSFAYITLDAGVGALLLFGFVQITMLGVGWLRGERPTGPQAVGIAVATGGMVWLCAPGVTAPDPLGAVLMSVAGIAWGVYSLLGRGSAAPATMTARNFVMAAPLGGLLLLVVTGDIAITTRGAVLAMVSGAVTSGMGYVVWYAALRGHTRTSAAAVQLVVPALAALGGVLFLGEVFTVRIAGAGLLTLGGVALAMRRRASG